jgi:hypothetical protein
LTVLQQAHFKTGLTVHEQTHFKTGLTKWTDTL